MGQIRSSLLKAQNPPTLFHATENSLVKRKVILLFGGVGAGKETFGRHLIRNFGFETPAQSEAWKKSCVKNIIYDTLATLQVLAKVCVERRLEPCSQVTLHL